MDKLKELDNIDEYLLKYVEGLKVSASFKKMLDNDINLQKKVMEIKSDLYMMEKIKDSKMYKEREKKASIKIKNNLVEYIKSFTLLTPLTSRNANTRTKIYYFQNASILIKGNIISLNIDKIETSLVILKDDVEIINASSLKEYSTNLEKGNYTIVLDDTTLNIDIE